MKSRNELVEEIVQSWETRFGRVFHLPTAGMDTLDEAKSFLRSSLLRISNASMDAVDVKEKYNLITEKRRLTYSDVDSAFNSAITASKEKRREWCEDK